jgi:spoIIIJ-associated protein
MTTDPITTLITEFLKKLGIQAESVTRVEIAAHPLYNIRTEDSKRIIGPQGEHLRALNLVIRRMAERIMSDDEAKFMVDVNGYHQQRISELEQKARLLADRVRTFRSSAELTPMNAYERMVIHAMFSEDPDVTTESEGTGKMRHVILRHRTP